MFGRGKIIVGGVLDTLQIPDAAMIHEEVEHFQKKKKTFFMRTNVPSYSAKNTNDYLNKTSFKDNRLIKWPVCTSSLNPIKNNAENFEGEGFSLMDVN